MTQPRAPRQGKELPQLELDCLAALWALESAPVAAVHQRLAAHGRPLAYTTVLTVLDRLRRKQVVTRERGGRAYVYRALIGREEMRTRALERMVHNYFDSRADLDAWLRKEPAASFAPQPALSRPAPDTEPAFID
ncbi:MAG: BlaI/MecI/CopY family transcriptional regulator [Terriglobales bacterium]